MSCYVCQLPEGCERCRGGPGEQGLSHDEKELLALRDENRRLNGLILKVECFGGGGAGVGCPWCGGAKGVHAHDCPAFSGPGAVR